MSVAKPMTTISALMHQSKFTDSTHPVLAIDGVSLDVWLTAKLDQSNILNLVPAQGWLTEDKDLTLAWRRLNPHEAGCSTIVPLLICPDDLDFECTVIVAEQDVTVDDVIWKRFGFAFDHPGDQVGASVKWYASNVSAKFNRKEFEQAVLELKRLTDIKWPQPE